MEQHEEQEHEVYEGDILDEEGEMDADVDMSDGAEDYEGNEHELEQDPNPNSKVTFFFLILALFSLSCAYRLMKKKTYFLKKFRTWRT